MSSNQWWPPELGSPSSSGAQNNIRYAVFPGRLAVELNGQITIYDTLDHQIGGVSQQQGGDTSLTFSSQYGTVAVTSLPVISGPGMAPAPQTNFAEPYQTNASYAEPQTEPVDAPVQTAEPAATAETEAPASRAKQNDPAQGSTESANTIIALIEKLGELKDAGILNEEEFNAKKSELLARL